MEVPKMSDNASRLSRIVGVDPRTGKAQGAVPRAGPTDC
jgi:hypothetical protein